MKYWTILYFSLVFFQNISAQVEVNDVFSVGVSTESDFLVVDHEDMFSPKTAEHKIIKHGNEEGVVNSWGEVLIPFKNWNVLFYEGKIAKVKRVVRTMGCEVDIVDFFILGYVDSTGLFIGEVEVQSELLFKSGETNSMSQHCKTFIIDQIKYVEENYEFLILLNL